MAMTVLPTLEHKSLAEAPLEELQFKTQQLSGPEIVDEEQGEVLAYIAGIGNRDSDSDIIMPGAFKDTLGARSIKVCTNHDWSQLIGIVQEAEEVLPGDPRLPAKMQAEGYGGLLAKIKVNRNSARGEQAWQDIKFFGEHGSWSIGYKSLGEYSAEKQANLLHQIDLYEASFVLAPANELCTTVAVKGLNGSPDINILVAGLGEEDGTRVKIAEAVRDALKVKKDYSAEQRQEMAKNGEALSDGSFPIKDCGDVEDAKHRIGTTNHPRATVISHINKRAKALGCPGVGETDESKELIDTIVGAPVFTDEQVEQIAKAIKGDPCECQEAKAEGLDLLSAAVEVKAGRVLSATHANHLNQAKEHIDHVLNAAAPKPDPDDTKHPAEQITDSHKTLEEAEELLKIAQIGVEAAILAQEADLLKRAEALHSLETSDEAWDGSPQWKNLPTDAAVLKAATAYDDPTKDPAKKSSYKLIHHFVSDEGVVGPASTAACLIGVGALNGKGSVVPDEDRESVFQHLKAHLEAAGNENVPELKITDPAILEKELNEWLAENYGDKAFHIEKHDDEYWVIGGESGTHVFGKHPNRPAAIQQLRALYANVPDAGKAATDPDDVGAGQPPGFTADRFDPAADLNPVDNTPGEPPSYTQEEPEADRINGAEPHNFVSDPDDPEACAYCGQPASAPIHAENIDFAKDKDAYSTGPGQFPGGSTNEDTGSRELVDPIGPHRFVPIWSDTPSDTASAEPKLDHDDMGNEAACKVCGMPEDSSAHKADPYGKSEVFSEQLKRIKHFITWVKDDGDSGMGTISNPDPDNDGDNDLPAHEFLPALGLTQLCAACGKVKASRKHRKTKKGYEEVKQVVVTDDDDDPRLLIQAIDAAIDEAMDELEDGEVDQATALIAAADQVVDNLLQMLGIPDPDDADEDEGEAKAVSLGAKELLDIEIALAEIELS